MSAATMFRMRRSIAALLAVLVAVPVLVFAAPASPVQAASYTFTLPVDTWVYRNSWLHDSSGRYALHFSDGGNLFLYEDDHPHPLWQTGTWHPSDPDQRGYKLRWQSDGNFVVYNQNTQALWHTHSYTNYNASLELQSDGNLVIYRNDRAVLWHASTYELPLSTQKGIMNQYGFGMSFATWKAWMASEQIIDPHETNITSWNGFWTYPWLNWINDQCSAPTILGNGFYNFREACVRHDFAYRNLQGASRDLLHSVLSPGYGDYYIWRGRNRQSADEQFKDDMYEHCAARWWAEEAICRGEAWAFWYAVAEISEETHGYPDYNINGSHRHYYNFGGYG